MGLFSEYLERKKEQILLEQPLLIAANTPEVVHADSKSVRDFISKNHDKADKIGENLYHLSPKGMHIYYGHDGKNIHELSVISSDIQVGADKHTGKAENIRKIMRYHLDTHGVLKSSNANTPGSKKLWTDFIKQNKDVKFKAVKFSDKSSYPVDHTNIDEKSPDIWGTEEKHQDTTLHASKT